MYVVITERFKHFFILQMSMTWKLNGTIFPIQVSIMTTKTTLSTISSNRATARALLAPNAALQHTSTNCMKKGDGYCNLYWVTFVAL